MVVSFHGPLEARWEVVKAEALALADAAEKQKGPAYAKLRAQMQEKLYAWLEELSSVRVLDPACGSGNFLYLALRRLLELWREVYIFSGEHGLPTLLPHQVRPSIGFRGGLDRLPAMAERQQHGMAHITL